MNYLKSKQSKIFIILIIIAIIFSTVVFAYTRKENIQNASISDLESVHEVGEMLSNQIYVYVQTNDIERVDELKGHIKYLGEVRLKELKKKYK